LNKFEDFYGFDHFSQALVGSFESKVEEKLRIGKIMIQKLLSKSNDECIFGITFKKISEMIWELSTSTIFLYQKTLFPFQEQQQEEEFNLPKDIPNEQAILSSLSLDSPTKKNDDLDLVWNYNSLYENQMKRNVGNSVFQPMENEANVQSKPQQVQTEIQKTENEVKNEQSEEVGENKTRWTKPYKWDNKKRGTSNPRGNGSTRGGGNRGDRGGGAPRGGSKYNFQPN
jgi:hypothetical protein